ncbi:MAG TPA: hypothetical protein VK030_07705, partial [Actinomycetales bacterium]|nr:hypothetical protein [Actinomycetales bacterium]
MSGRLAAIAAGSALFLAPVVSSAVPYEAGLQSQFGTAPLAASTAAPAGPAVGFEDNAARAVYWLAQDSLEDLSLDAALAFIGAGYGEAVRDEVLDWAK